jgi:hypothetical protein
MATLTNPPAQAFTEQIGDALVFGQVEIRRAGDGFELRHIADRTTPDQDLEATTLPSLRTLAERTADGAFRPLKTAPNLRRGWRLAVGSASELAEALGHLYPGAVADWFAARQESPPVTHYRDFTNRQTGMYRVTQHLDDAQVATVVRAACPARFCLKSRLWTIPGLEPDAPESKSLIPCLEPCAILLEFTRKAARIEQQEKQPLALTPAELDTIKAALEHWLATGDPTVREGNFESPANPRRIALVLEKLRALPATPPARAAQE